MNTIKMSKISLGVAMALGLVSGAQAATPTAVAPPSTALNQEASVLVFPLIDTIGENETVIDIANTSGLPQWVSCQLILKDGLAPGGFTKEDFKFLLTPHQKVAWKVSEGTPSIPDYNLEQGMMFCYESATNNLGQLVGEEETVNTNALTGEALIYGDGVGTSYNAIPHQGLAVVNEVAGPDLNFNGLEYSFASSKALFSGFTAGTKYLDGTNPVSGFLAVALMDIDYLASAQPTVDINAKCWNAAETPYSRHTEVYQWAKIPLTRGGGGLNLVNKSLGKSAVFNCEAKGTYHTGGSPSGNAAGSLAGIYAVLFEQAGNFAWSNNVWETGKIGDDAPAFRVRLP
jgi:hypothetical protein